MKDDVSKRDDSDRWSTPTLKASWYDDDDVTENALKATARSPLLEQPYLTVKGFFDLLAPEDPPTS